MMRISLGLLLGLVTPAALNIAIGYALGYAPSPMFWSHTNQYSLLAVLFLASGTGAFAAARLASRATVAAVAAVFSLVVSYDWWQAGDAGWVFVAIALCGIAGATVGGLPASRQIAHKGADAAA